MNNQPKVYIIDDDEDARDSVCALVHTMGLNAEAFTSGEDFLTRFNPSDAGCVVTDLRMLGMSGLELQATLAGQQCAVPIILVSAYVDVENTVQAMKWGALTVLKKPYRDQQLWDAIQQALKLDGEHRKKQAWCETLRVRFEKLTAQERDVLGLISKGNANKTVARALDISVRTVEDRRHKIMQKLQADSFAQLMELVIEARQVEQPR